MRTKIRTCNSGRKTTLFCKMVAGELQKIPNGTPWDSKLCATRKHGQHFYGTCVSLGCR